MPQAMLARVTCPNCNNQFQTPVEQILDVGTDPNAKMRVFNGQVNVAVCPQCKTGGSLDLPFLYHDADKELALVYMPMQAGRTDLERQQAIGKLTRAVMDSLPPDERKAYLLQPQVLLTMENLTNKILEADGITPEMIEEQKAKADLLRRMFQTTSDKALEAMIAENDALIDSEFFDLLSLNIEMAQGTGQAAAIGPILALREKLVELSSEGQTIKAQGEAVEALRAEPTREKLLELLGQTADARTHELLIAFGRSLLDYSFFQSLTAQIKAAVNEGEKEQLTALRAEVLDVRDRIDERTRALYQVRSALLQELLLSDDPADLARRRSQELDQVFFGILTANIKDAQAKNNKETVTALRSIQDMILRLIEETLPPEIRLVNRLMAAGSESEIEEMLRSDRDLLTEQLVQFVEGAEADSKEKGDAKTSDRLALILRKINGVMAGV